MKRTWLILCAASLLVEGAAFGQAPPPASLSPEMTVSPISIVEGAGIKVGEGTVLHPVLGLETGLVSNVFYEDVNPNGAGLLRLLGEVGVGSLSVQRLTVVGEGSDGAEKQPTDLGRFAYHADLRLAYDFMLSGNDAVTAQGGLGIGAAFQGVVNPQGLWDGIHPWTFTIKDDFNRLIRAANFETTDDTNRDINRLHLAARFQPRGRSMAGTLRYQNAIDVFESSNQQFADRMTNTVGFRFDWRLFPLTFVYGDVSQGVITPIGSDVMGVPPKVASYPLVALAGVQTLLTAKTTLVGRIGYTNGFYSSGPSYSSMVGGAELGFRYSPLGRVTVMYSYEHHDSINANYYRDHVVGATLEQKFVPLLFVARGELHLRNYVGVIAPGASSPDRADFITAVTAGLRYSFRDWLAITADYRFSTVQTDFTYMPDPGGVDVNPSYIRHELLAGVRAAL